MAINLFNSAWRCSLWSALLLSTTSGCWAQGPQTPPCGKLVVQQDAWVEGLHFKRGIYRIHTFGISCDKLLGEHGIFDQFLHQDQNTPLPKPWKYLSDAIGFPKFVAASGVGFRVQWLSD